ncbi:hypothetical protein LAZ67_7000975, partial [Cordylochernes scorpioides]
MEGEKMEISNVFSVLADGQYEGEHDGVVSGDKSPANAEILAEITSKKNSTNSETLENYAKLPVTSGGNANFPQSSRNWADIVENDENFEQPKKRKRLLPSERASQSLPGPSRQTKTTRDSTTPRQPSFPRNTIEQIKVSRQMLAQCRSKAAAGTYDQMTYLEFSPEFTQVDYIKALENKLGKGCVVQIGKASGQILVGFERPDMAETIIEDGLTIKGALLKALPYQKKAEKITISGLPFVIEDADIIRTLRPYCQAPSQPFTSGYLTSEQRQEARKSFRLACLNVRGIAARHRSIELCCFLKQHAVDIAFIQETNVTTLDSVEDLCLGYRAAVVPASGARGSGLACIFSSGVQVIGQQVLSPGKIAAFDVTIRGSKATFVNCHLSHAPDERLQQLQVITAAAVNEDAWVLGDLNISEESASDIASGSVEALGELLDRANLVDAAAIFDATHLPTRISSCGSRVDASRLDRVLIPSSFSNRVTRYWSLYYKNSDHRAVLLQTGEASEPRPPCIASMLRSRLVVGTVETLLDEALGNIEDMRNAEIWRRWGHIKAHLASAIKSLHDLRNNDDDYISRARKYVQAKLEDVSIYSDYPSLPDLGRAFRLRRRGTSSNTFYDSAGRMITGPAVRELAFVNLKERFSHPSCSPEDIDGFLRGFTLRVTIEESDPLHRYGIGEEEIVAAIGRLPTGKAAGWDDLPCELFRGFEDYFASALRRVFEASQLCGALPTSMRRSEMSLIEKPHGGPGLAGLRPLSLPTTDYRVLSGVLYWRLRPHLRDIVPECQSYAVPGRTPAWNIARVADEVATACRDEAPLAVVAIDLESAFDTLDRGFLVSTLLSVGLPPVFVGWVLLLYAGAEAAARIERIGRTPLFHMLNGVRQGCAASAAFSTISTGPLLLRLEQLLGRDNVLAYADDIVLLIREDGQLEVVRKIFEDFRRASGIRVNFGKSQGLWCGRWRNRTDSPSAISWNREKINILGTLVTPGMGTSAQDQHLQELLERAIARWSPFVRGLSLAGRAKAANSLVLSAIYYHLQAYLPSETTIGRLQARLARFVWGHDRTSWLPSSILARPISVGGMGLLDVGTQLRLSCLKGVQAALRGGRNAHSWLAESGMWLTPASTPGIWLPPRRRRSLHLFEPAAEILDLNHRILQPALLRALRVVGDCRFLRPPELLAPTRWLGWRIGELTGPAPNITIATRGALTDVAALESFCTRLITQNARGHYRVDSLADAIVVRGTTTAFQRLTTRTARRLLERPRLAALPITQLFGRWFPHVSIPISISWSSLRRCAFSGHNADVAVRLALHALPHPAHPASARESCIACGSGDLSLAHRYWSCSRIRPVILEAFTIIQRPPDLQSWIFGLDLEDDALAIMASAKTRIYKHFLGLEMRGVQEDPLLVWRRTLSSQDDDKFDGGTPTQKRPTNAEKSAEEVFKPDSKNTFSIKQTTGDYVNQAAGKKQADANWAERVEASEKQSALESDWKIPKSNKRKGRDSPTQQAKVAKAEAIVAGPSLQPRREVRDAVTHIRASRQQQDLAKARSAAATFYHCCFIEWIPDFHQVQYMKALEQMLGKSSVHQLMKMSGHVLVTLPSAEKAERLIEEGLTIGSTLLRAFPYRKRAEKIIIGNLPIAVRDDDIVATLRPYCKVASMAYEIVTCEASVIAKDIGVPAVPGETWKSALQPTSQHGSRPPSTQTSPSSQPAATTPAAIGHNGPEKAPAKNVHILMKPPPANKTSGTKALPAAAEVATSSKERPPNIAAPILTIAPGSRIPLKTNPLSKEDESSTDKRSTALRQLEEVLKQLPDTVFENTEAAGMEKEKIVQAIISERNLKKFLPDQKPEQLDSLINLIGTFVDRVEDKACHLYKRLTHLRQHAVDVAFVQETNVLALNNIRDLCLGYSAVFAPSSTPRGSGLAVVAAPGVTVLWHRVLWPGKIAIASVKIRGLETRVINCHLSHTPEERHLQLQIIAEEAIREYAWVLGDINISEESSSDIGSGAVEAFAELLDRTALVDIAAIFDAAHLPTRVASYGSRVDAARLDRVLIPSRLSGRVTRYWTLNYRNSDHRAILLQVGDPPSPSAPSISALLRSAPVIERIEALLSEASQEIEGNPTGDLWGKWGKLKRELVEDIKERFNGSTCSPEDIAGFLEGATECITLEDSDPLHRADISLNEVEVAISRLPQGKAAGWDGIPCELVKGFEDFFGGVIHQVLAESKLRGTLPESSRRNIICLVPKAHGGPGLSGYRPISLPTADYRIVSGVLLGRLRRHLPAIVPDCQTYAVPGRCPSWNIACVSDEVALAFKNKTPLAVISTDLQSAFDNVDREFLASQLRTIGLPLPFMEWLHLLYAEADATIKVNGNFTRPFKMRRGLRQGCACSAALFSIFTGPLLRHLERILGRGNVLAYADDILLLIREDWQFERVKTIFDEFRRASGVSVNFPKSKGLWCGAWRDRADSPLGISWSASSITVLGCEITSGHGTSVQENHLLGILERAISRWSPFVRGFSLVGRARAANSLVLAAVLHHLHGYLPGDATIAKLQARLTRFVWGSCHRAAWLPGGLLARPVSVGGVGLLDIRTQLQLACFKGVQAASGNGGKNAYSWLVESGAWMTPLSSGSWLLPRRRRLLDLWEQASSILGLNHRVVPAPTLLNLPLVGACRFLATPSLRAPSRWRGVRVRDLAGPAPPPVARPTRSACDDAAALGAFCQRLVADNATSVYRERTLEEAVVLRGTATPFLRISTRTARRMLERPRLAALPISRFLRRWAPVVGVPSASTPCSSLRRCSFGGHAADIALRLALHALPHPGHPASSQPVCIACGSSDLSLAHRYWSCSAVRPLIREAFSIIGRPPDLQSWIFAVGLEDHAITISSAAKHAIYVFFVDREMRVRTVHFTCIDKMSIKICQLSNCLSLSLSLGRAATRRASSAFFESEMEAMETNNPFGVLAESQENGLQAHMNSTENPQGSTEISVKESDMAESLSDSNNRKDANSEPAADGGHANSRRNWADCPELDDQLPEAEDGIFTTVGGSKKRRHDPDHPNSAAKKGCVQAPRIAPNSSRPRVTPRASRVRECQTTRQKQATFRARSAAMQADQCVYLEFCPDFTEDQYFLALEAKLGKGTVYQLTKMEGQFLVGLSGVQQADKLVEDGLEIEDALLRATPLKKRAERIMFGNVPFFVENLDLVAALQPFGQITSIVQKMKELGESYWADARREAFITLRDGVKLSHIPARLNIIAKGVTSHVYVTYGIRCSLCYKHGHKRANCPRKTGVQEANLLLHLDPPAGPNNAGGRQPSSSNVMPAPVPTPAAGPSSTAAPIPDVTPEPPAAPPTPATSPAPPAAPAPAPETLPTASVDPVPPTSKQCRGGARKTHKKSNVTRTQLNELLERIHSNILDKSGLEGLEREEVLDALASVP